jgi:hypothetical protein
MRNRRRKRNRSPWSYVAIAQREYQCSRHCPFWHILPGDIYERIARLVRGPSGNQVIVHRYHYECPPWPDDEDERRLRDEQDDREHLVLEEPFELPMAA